VSSNFTSTTFWHIPYPDCSVLARSILTAGILCNCTPPHLAKILPFKLNNITTISIVAEMAIFCLIFDWESKSNLTFATMYSRGAQFRSFFVKSNFDGSIIVEIVDQNSCKLIYILELSFHFVLKTSNLPWKPLKSG
jgi:hypothetical protein